MSEQKKMPNQGENIFLNDLMILRNNLVRYSESVHERLAPFPGAWRDLRLMLHLVRKTQAILLDTVPDVKLAQLYHVAQVGKFLIELPGPLRKNRMVNIDENSLATLTQCALNGECVMCLREGKEITRCPLRNALIMATPPEKIIKDPPLLGCEYRDIACALLRGENVEI